MCDGHSLLTTLVMCHLHFSERKREGETNFIPLHINAIKRVTHPKVVYYSSTKNPKYKHSQCDSLFLFSFYKHLTSWPMKHGERTDLNLEPTLKRWRKCLSATVEVNKHFVSWGQVVLDHRVAQKIGDPCIGSWKLQWVHYLHGSNFLPNRKPVGDPSKGNVKVSNVVSSKKLLPLNLFFNLLHRFSSYFQSVFLVIPAATHCNPWWVQKLFIHTQTQPFKNKLIHPHCWQRKSVTE